jgi:cell division protein FtsA
MSEHCFAALDIGSSQARVLIAEVDHSGLFCVRGVGVVPTDGLRQGVIVDMDAAVTAIQEATSMAEEMASMQMPAVDAAFSGAHILSINSAGSLSLREELAGESPTVTDEHLEAVLENSRSMQLPIDKCLLHVVPKGYDLDGRSISHPPGQRGFRLQAYTHLLLASLTAKRNLERCIAMAGLTLNKIILSPLAAAPLVMQPRDLNLGSVLVDIGGGTLDALFFVDGALEHTWVFPFAGERVTRDVALVLQTSLREAESLKQGAASADPLTMPYPDSRLQVKQVHSDDPQILTSGDLSRIVEARLSEVFGYLMDEMSRMSLVGRLEGSVVLTGGTARMPGLVDLAEKTLHMTARLGQSSNFIGPKDLLMGGDFAPALGLLLRRAADDPEFDTSHFPVLDQLTCVDPNSKKRPLSWRRVLEPITSWRQA